MATIRTEGRKVSIEGVRRISWDTGEMCEFASALAAATECLGEQAPYHEVMGTSGAAFRFALAPGAWDFGNYGIRNFSADPREPMRRAIAATGFKYTLYNKGLEAEDAARIRASIDRGAPVLAYPVVGPSDCCIIAGYDQDGEVLLGWSTYQDIPDDHNIPHDPTGYFRKPGWHDNLVGYIVLGAPGQRPPRRQVYLEALRWAVRLMLEPQLQDKRTGLEGLRVWAEEMVQEAYFPAGDAQVLGHRYVSAAINMTMLRDHLSAGPFLRQVAAGEPDLAEGLAGAIACYDQVGALRAELDNLMSDNFAPQAMAAIADAAARRAYADILLRIRDVEAEAASRIERAIRGAS